MYAHRSLYKHSALIACDVVEATCGRARMNEWFDFLCRMKYPLCMCCTHGDFKPLTVSFGVFAGEVAHRWKRQTQKPQTTTEEAPKKEGSFEVELCKNKDAGEWFRLVAGEGDNCRDVIQCTSSVSNSKIIN